MLEIENKKHSNKDDQKMKSEIWVQWLDSIHNSSEVVFCGSLRSNCQRETLLSQPGRADLYVIPGLPDIQYIGAWSCLGWLYIHCCSYISDNQEISLGQIISGHCQDWLWIRIYSYIRSCQLFGYKYIRIFVRSRFWYEYIRIFICTNFQDTTDSDDVFV